MSAVIPRTLQRAPLPPDPRSFVNFSGELGATIERLTREAVEAGRWRSPEDIELNPKNPLSLAYWLYKSWNPIVRGMPGCGIEERLDPFRRTHFDLMPAGFEVEAGRTLSAAGDLMCTKGLDGARDRFYEEVADLIFDADISFANLESTLTTGEIAATTFTADDTPSINLTPAQYEAVVWHRGRRFDVLQLANNHILDCGEEGIRTTLDRLRNDGIAQVVAEGHFPAGSMGPKVEAILAFHGATGGRGVISPLEDIGRAVAGGAGTEVTGT